MALARIITRSQACSRELALDLLSRGYAVEIVSPDAIPDNIADLELRVEEDPGNQLVATVEAHNGERSASLEFLHYLKAPMPDFVRRPPESREVTPLVEEPRSANAEAIVGNRELPADASQVATQAVTPLPETSADFEERACLIAAPVTPSQVEVPRYFATEEPSVAPNIVAAMNAERLLETESFRPESPQGQARQAGWIWRMALTSAAVIALALLLAFGMRRNGQASGQSNGSAPAEKTVAVSANEVFVGAADSGTDAEKESRQVAASAISPIKGSEANSGQAVRQIPVTESAPAIESPRPRISLHHEDEIVARDTVTYLDKRFEPRAPGDTARKAKASKHLARHHRGPHQHRGEVIAANKVTYLDKPTPKTAK